MTDTKISIKVSDSPRIVRIFEKICSSQLQVYVRVATRDNLTIKARAVALEEIFMTAKETQPSVILEGISEKGIKFLEDKEALYLEFGLLESKIVAPCKLLRLGLGSGRAFVSLPTQLESIKRRSSTRHKVSGNLAAFFAFNFWQPEAAKLIAPPFFPQHQGLAALLPLLDVSSEGFCLVSRFPDLSSALTPELRESAGKLYLPLCPSLELGVSIRWVKLIKEHTQQGENYAASKFFYYLGCQISEHSPQSHQSLKVFIQSLAEAEAL